MAATSRERINVNVRGLGAAMKACARARGLTVSDVARRAIGAMLEVSAADPGLARDSSTSDRKLVRLGIRLPREVAGRLSERARASGLSPGGYLARLIDETPAPPVAVSAALGESTEQLAVLFTDLSELLRTLARGNVASGLALEESVRALVNDVRRHIAIASRLVAELRPARPIPDRRSSTPAATRDPCP
jgi:hypothetical protein